MKTMFDSFLENLYAEVAKIPFDWLIWFTFGSFAAIYFVCLGLTIGLKRFKTLSKRPFLCLVNAYSAVTLAFFLTENQLIPSLFITVLFWLAGYVLYGTLCLASANRRKAQPRELRMAAVVQPAAVSAATTPLKPVRTDLRADLPAARNSVRLEHAISVTDKLLEKNLGKSDRQELEKLKNTLAVLQIKGTLSTAEADILNENFNTLLKLMAKYNV